MSENKYDAPANIVKFCQENADIIARLPELVGQQAHAATTQQSRDMSERKPRLFYWEDAEDAWCPAEGLGATNIVDPSMLDNEEIVEIQFKRIDMTDDEFNNLPEV